MQEAADPDQASKLEEGAFDLEGLLKFSFPSGSECPCQRAETSSATGQNDGPRVINIKDQLMEVVFSRLTRYCRRNSVMA